MSEQRLPIHPYAELFPPMSLAEFERLCDDIQQHGLQEEIVLLEGKVLEGRNRYFVCLARGIEPRFRPYAGECGSPLAFVVSRNLHRRHLTESQRALVAARLKPLFEEEARQREAARKRERSDQGEKFCPLEKHEEKGKSAQKAAQLMKVSHMSVKFADKVQKQGVEPLIAAVGAGKVSVSAGARIAALPAEQQQAVMAGIESGLKPKQALAQVQKAAPGAPAPWVDDEGTPLPESTIPAFRDRRRLDEVCRRLDGVARDLERLRKSPAMAHIDLDQVSGPLKAAGRTLAAGRPSRLCQHPSEAGAVCEACRGPGWVPAGARACAHAL